MSAARRGLRHHVAVATPWRRYALVLIARSAGRHGLAHPDEGVPVVDGAAQGVDHDAPSEHRVVGHGVEGLAAECAAHGADRVLLADHAGLEAYASESYRDAVVAAVRNLTPDAVLLPAG